ncbi:Swi5-domain-containing protein [Penicillium macrosclerotiorum]|uniref:Swi5-domain-containing protein n=1 Tax=Penicillium macrosclerotiorum TaxID=303699 RepID=UPI002549B11E|nr:Swi5-domain-containing protein [Penicillium macrosclerotiorum]KAJ5693407.1 Swi5-domain-containing protein [Penicillium macrosclerotiorum]
MSIASLETQKAQLEAEIEECRVKLSHDPSKTVKRHIHLLHEYNEVKDVAQGLMGLIAEAQGVQCADVQREYGVREQD